MPTLACATPLGTAHITGTADHITRVTILDEADGTTGEAPALLHACAQQLDEYFAGTRQTFDLPLQPQGTEFQQRVWNELTNIPYGETRTYQDLAHALGDPGAVRAVGAANGQNPLWILLPCHRVIGSDGSLTGYAGGLERKRWLLTHERRTLAAATGWGLRPDARH